MCVYNARLCLSLPHTSFNLSVSLVKTALADWLWWTQLYTKKNGGRRRKITKVKYYEQILKNKCGNKNYEDKTLFNENELGKKGGKCL